MITELTQEQWRRIGAERERWLAAGKSTAPADRDATGTVLAEMYALLGKPAPKIFWFDGPLSCVLAAPLIAAAMVGAGSGELYSQLYSQLSSQLYSQLYSQLGELLLKAWGCRWSSLWSSWWMHCASVRDVCGVRYTDDQNAALDRWLKLVPGCSWFFVFGDFVVCSERYESFQMDERGRLHSADGPALRCKDGYELYAWHGTRVLARVIKDPGSFTAAELAAERNSEIHRAIGEKLGWERYLTLLGVKAIDEWRDPTTELEYQLLEPATRIGELQPRYLKMRSPALHDGTRPWFIEPVHPELTTAQAARKWQIQLSKDKDARYYRHGDVVVTYAPPESLYWPEPEECNRNPKLEFVQEA